ncbi:hypothetical protein Agabi119p4_10616 [Agaricus bisporus var. burnettii]|uniref:F-box domain-containing protein n=1 Tax=Agaricus bisporus var. burnettii TaxID=192524 RepID=A0A8H7C2D2_AGABI|nr:hypothetical protein Agabi119p4_10616 [Agaricus bisporus var. burnettii]
MVDNLTASRCPTCLQTKPGTTSAALTSQDVWEDDPDAEIEHKIEHIENLISSLFREKTRLCKKRNELRSPIYSLFPEILALIFEFACPPLDFLQMYGMDSYISGKAASPHIILMLTAVSTRWHDVVLSMPSLWTSFVADDSDVNIMKIILSRSKNLPVAASLHFPEDSVSYESHEAMLAPVLQEHASRIRMLYVYNAPSTWLNDHIPTFIHIELVPLEAVEGVDYV